MTNIWRQDREKLSVNFSSCGQTVEVQDDWIQFQCEGNVTLRIWVMDNYAKNTRQVISIYQRLRRITHTGQTEYPTTNVERTGERASVGATEKNQM